MFHPEETPSFAGLTGISPAELVGARATLAAKGDAPIELGPADEPLEETVFDLLGYVARLEASTGAALALLRRCIVEEEKPTRQSLAAEAEYAFGMPGEAALAEMDQVAEIVGVSSLR